MIKKFKQTGVDLTRKANQNTRNMGPSPQPDRVKNSGITEVGNPDLDGLKIVLLRMNPSASGPMHSAMHNAMHSVHTYITKLR